MENKVKGSNVLKIFNSAFDEFTFSKKVIKSGRSTSQKGGITRLVLDALARPEQTTYAKVESVKMVLENLWITIRVVGEDVGISVGSCRPELWNDQAWILHHDKAPTHSSILIRYFLTKNNRHHIRRTWSSPVLMVNGQFPVESTFSNFNYHRQLIRINTNCENYSEL